MDRVRLAVIGAGQMGSRHARLISASEHCCLVGVADTDPARRPIAEALGVPFYGDAEALLRREQPAGAVIATANAQHAAAATVCASQSVHVLVEKPIADTLVRARQIAAAAARHRIRVLVGHHRRHNPLLRQTRQLVQDGALGRLVGVSVLWTLLKPDDYFQVAWRGQRPGGGPLLINLVHDLDSLRFICGEVTEVFARATSAARGLEVEDSVGLALTFASGALGTILASDATPAAWSYEANAGENPDYFHVRENCYHFVGTEGALAFPRMELWRYRQPPRRGWRECLQRDVVAVDRADPLTRQLEHFCRVVRDEEAPAVDAEDGTRTLALALAAAESARGGRPIDPSALT